MILLKKSFSNKIYTPTQALKSFKKGDRRTIIIFENNLNSIQLAPLNIGYYPVNNFI